MKEKIYVKKIELDVSNKQRIIDKLLQQVKVQTERAELLIANKSANWESDANYSRRFQDPPHPSYLLMLTLIVIDWICF